MARDRGRSPNKCSVVCVFRTGTRAVVCKKGNKDRVGRGGVKREREYAFAERSSHYFLGGNPYSYWLNFEALPDAA